MLNIENILTEWKEDSVINGLQFFFASGNISTGKITLYGRAT